MAVKSRKATKTPVKKQETIKTPEQQALSVRLNKKATDWKTITEGDITDFSLREDPYKLPPKAQKMQDKKRYAFRWAVATPERIDELETLDPPAKWWHVNSTQPPGLEEYCDPIHGGIKKLDQILFFKPWWMHKKFQDMKMDLAAIKDANADINTRNGQKNDYGEWISGEKARISGNDQVMSEDMSA